MDTKKWYQSTAIWGGIVVVCSTLLSAVFKVEVSQDEQQAITGTIVNFVTVAGQLLGGLLAVYGRLKATKEIK